ncbi:hypothetical protein FGO68_gene12786 [Halteria grandinella]|uniref:Uncharacterized protein n=1 Tax=Halteria grandinella TaxID=5974 RepID=A0A8J8SWH5_HALGN|nr:hypothetical protein FGO68_gene12786 [Halteria grandinella]
MLSDGDLSEDYDNDAVYFSFDDSVRVQLITTHHAVTEEAKGAVAQDEEEEEDVFTATKKALEESKQATGENPENTMGAGDDEGARGGEDADMMPQEEGEQEQQKQRLVENGLQKSVTFRINFLNEGAKYASYGDYEQREEEIKKKLELKRMIDTYHDTTMLNKYVGYQDFFNYGLNTTTWRLVVNKQILMRYERLFIERQMNEGNTEKKRLESELENLQREIERVREQQKEVSEGGASASKSSAQGGFGSNNGHHRGGNGNGQYGRGNKRVNYGGQPGSGTGGNFQMTFPMFQYGPGMLPPTPGMVPMPPPQGHNPQ